MTKPLQFLLTNALFAILLVLTAGCLAPMGAPSRPPDAPASVPQGSLGDSLLKGLDKLNEGLQGLAKASALVAQAPAQYDVAVKQARAQADLNGNGTVDPSERALYYSILSGLLATAGSTGLTGLIRGSGRQEIKERLDALESAPAPKA